nr:uncharacterized protein LOC119161852 [Rhipicephalus microplus]
MVGDVGITEDQTRLHIIKRHELRHLFTGKRNAAKQGWQKIIQDLDLHRTTPEQCRKKWLNLMGKYKVIRIFTSAAGMPDLSFRTISDPGRRSDSERREERPKPQNRSDVMERILTNVERHTELMGRMFDYL